MLGLDSFSDVGSLFRGCWIRLGWHSMCLGSHVCVSGCFPHSITTGAFG
jgi:hypothetical protein